MIVLQVEGVKKHFGPEPVLDGVTFDVRPGQRIGLAGPNGAGKTTLLQILAGRDDADAGSVQFHPAVRTGYLEQQPIFEPGRTLWDEAHAALDHLLAIQREAIDVAEALAANADPAEHDRLAARYDHLQQELHRHDAYNLEYKVERVLDGLGFRRESFRQPIDSLSGGEQNRVMLAKLLLAEPDLMLLDEPSNHLDIEATEWLENFLTASSAAMLLVSHDRYFLDKVTNRTLELFRGTVDSYVGNFSAYWQQKDERLLVQRRTYEKQQQEIAKTEDFIRRNAYGQKHAQAEDRRKKLARIEPVAAPREIALPAMGFPAAARSGDIVLRVEGLAKRYDRPLFDDVTFDILRGQRWGLLGPNGCGKTTLLKCLLGQVSADAGRAVLGQGVAVGYFDQQLAGLDEQTAVVDAIRPDRKDFVEQQRRDLLARFGLTGDTALQNVGKLSGGERCRAALARLAATDANFLVLDEPTNHLDLWARDALERALAKFDGTVLFVSHDRYFVDRVADHLLVVEKDRTRLVEGNYAAYQRLLHADDQPAPTPIRKPLPAAHSQKPAGGGKKTSNSPKPAAGSRKPGHGSPGPSGPDQPKPSRNQRRFPFRKVSDLEAEIAEKEAKLQDLHALLAKPETHRDGARAKQLKATIEREKDALRQLYEHWEEATELNW
jgi:ATP-binding cassette subfamily F protein 3